MMEQIGYQRIHQMQKMTGIITKNKQEQQKVEEQVTGQMQEVAMKMHILCGYQGMRIK